MNTGVKMKNRSVTFAGWMIASSFILHPSSFLYADGGTFRTMQRRGDFRVSVFTAPTWLRTGDVDISVLVQEWETGKVRTDVPTTIKVHSLESSAGQINISATNEAATNKLFRAAKIGIMEPSTWRVEVILDDQPTPPIQFDIDIEAGLPQSWNLSLWVLWPFGVVMLFLVHQCLLRRRIKG